MTASFPLHAEKKAFIVGINLYENLGEGKKLERAVSDADSIAETLKNLDYKIAEEIDSENARKFRNTTRSEFNEIWQYFLESISKDDTVVFYFAGHGIEIEGHNFLIPSDVPFMKYGRQEQIKRESLSFYEIAEDLRERKPENAIFILDACRDNPFVPPQYRNISIANSGLLSNRTPQGQFIIYAAGDKQVALDKLSDDDDDPNSVFTRVLLDHISSKIDLVSLARTVREDVQALAEEHDEFQRPSYYDNLSGEFCFPGCVKPSLSDDVTASIDVPSPTNPTTTWADTIATGTLITESVLDNAVLGVECRKSSDRGCTAHAEDCYVAPSNFRIVENSISNGVISNFWGKNPTCGVPRVSKLDDSGKPIGFCATHHVESGSGVANLGKVAYVSCEYQIELTAIPL